MTIYSHTRLSAFESCQLKFKFAYIDKLETEVEKSIEAFLGTLVHQTLEKLYKDMNFQKQNTLQELLDYFNLEWKRNWNKEIIIVRKTYTEENYRKMGEKFLTDYYNKYYPFNHTRTIDLEKRILIILDSEGKFQLQGYIDRIAYASEGVYEIHDYKTNANMPIQDYLEGDRQLALYAIAVRHMYPDAKDVKLIWHFLAFDKEVMVRKTDHQLEQLKKDTIGLIKKIEATKEFKPHVSALCDWCEFRPACPEWSHLYQLEKKPLNKYLTDNGVELVNKYAEIYNQKQHTEAELEKLKEAIIDFAKKNNATTIFGSDNKVKINTYDNLRFPDSEDKRREVLEKLLKQLGLWDKVSRLDLITLSKMVQSQQLPDEILKELEKFYTKEKTNIIRVSKFEKKEY